MTVPQFFNLILDLIFPNVCGMCNKISKKSICDECLNQIEIYKNINKIECFNQLSLKLNSKIYFDEQIYFYKYQGEIREKLIQYKFNDKPYYYKMFAELIISEKLINFCKKYDAIIPIPIGPKRKKERGYNQTELIAKELIKQMQIQNITLVTNVVVKIKNIKPQSSMISKKERIENIKGVYELKNVEQIKGKNIIILDDIFTTGSTVNECAKVLKKNGVNKVGIVTIARD